MGRKNSKHLAQTHHDSLRTKPERKIKNNPNNLNDQESETKKMNELRQIYLPQMFMGTRRPEVGQWTSREKEMGKMKV